ncbi:MAG: hypothetical protein WAL37_11985 [Xanthobacteraceae bacterium]
MASLQSQSSISSAVLVELIDEVERAIDAAAQTAKEQNDRALDITNADARRAPMMPSTARFYAIA